MNVYKIKGDFDNFDTCYVDVEACRKTCWPGGEFSFGSDGTRKADTWWPRIMVREHDAPLGDYISCLQGDVLPIKKSTVEILAPVMEDYEVLPLICDFGDYVCLNILTVLDCIDYENSEFIRFTQRDPNVIPRIMRFTKYAFRPDVLEGHHIFRTTDERGILFVDDVFVEEVKKQGITGFAFNPVWQG